MSPVSLATSERGSGAPLVLLHAFPLHSGLFAALGDIPGHRLITPDLRGFGSSPRGDDPPSLAAMADDVVALLDRLNLETSLVGGVSMGGYVVMEMLRRVPHRLGGVLLLDTKAEADTEEARAGRVAMADGVRRDGTAALAPMTTVLLGSTSLSTRPDVVEEVTAWLHEADPESVAWAQHAMAARPDSAATLASTGVPGAVVVGQEDVLSPPAQARAMADALGTQAIEVPGAGHLAVMEDPAAVRDALSAALSEIGRRATRSTT